MHHSTCSTDGDIPWLKWVCAKVTRGRYAGSAAVEETSQEEVGPVGCIVWVAGKRVRWRNEEEVRKADRAELLSDEVWGLEARNESRA